MKSSNVSYIISINLSQTLSKRDFVGAPWSSTNGSGKTDSAISEIQ